MSRKGKRVALVALLLAAAVPIVLLWLAARKGYSARQTPSALERAVARRLRHLATPPTARDARNPVALTSQVLARAQEHFADHCATCHAHDGSGRTEIGAGMYPPPPDLRRTESQALSDGEIFYVIRNGIRFTGMPGWGTGPEAEDVGSWELVHFIRHLPRLTEKELEEMAEVNPRGRSVDAIERDRRRRGNASRAGDEAATAHGGHEH